jgi:hypothetical protein
MAPQNPAKAAAEIGRGTDPLREPEVLLSTAVNYKYRSRDPASGRLPIEPFWHVCLRYYTAEAYPIRYS